MRFNLNYPVTPLRAIPQGHLVRIEAVEGSHAWRRRLLELGLVPGTVVRVVRRSLTQGLLELDVRGSRLSLRMDEAKALLTSPTEKAAQAS